MLAGKSSVAVGGNSSSAACQSTKVRINIPAFSHPLHITAEKSQKCTGYCCALTATDGYEWTIVRPASFDIRGTDNRWNRVQVRSIQTVTTSINASSACSLRQADFSCRAYRGSADDDRLASDSRVGCVGCQQGGDLSKIGEPLTMYRRLRTILSRAT